MIEKIKEVIGKKVFIELQGGRYYNGVINEVNDNMISMTDKFNQPVFIAISEIKFLQVKE